MVESWGAGVATAVLGYTRHAPHHEHHLLHGQRAETAALPVGWRTQFASATPLPAGHLRRIRAVGAAARDLRADTVHAHSSFAGAYTRLGMCNSRSRPIIYTPHAYAFERGDLPAAMRMAVYGFEWLLALNTSTVAGCSPRETRLGNFRFSPARAIHLPNVIDPAALDLEVASNRSDDGAPLRVAGSGRIGAQKDPDYFIECINVLRQAGHHVAASWIGGGEPGAEERLRLAGVTVTGWLDRFTASTLLAGHDLYLHTAGWEGFPMAVLEAEKLGVATVVRNGPHFEGFGLPLQITAPGDLATHWERFSTPAARRQLVEKTSRALAGHTPEAQAEALEALYTFDGVSARRPRTMRKQANHA